MIVRTATKTKWPTLTSAFERIYLWSTNDGQTSWAVSERQRHWQVTKSQTVLNLILALIPCILGYPVFYRKPAHHTDWTY